MSETLVNKNQLSGSVSQLLIASDYSFISGPESGINGPVKVVRANANGNLVLIVGSNSILLEPVPMGVNWYDLNHYLYISGGTGAPENVLITGGDALGGELSGTIIVTCANGHSGTWTIGSSTGGVEEAMAAVPGCIVFAGSGYYVSASDLSVSRNLIASKGPNYISSDSGSNNAIAVILYDTTSLARAIPLNPGLRISIQLSHSLQAGANTLSFNGVVKNIKSGRNPSLGITVPYVTGGLFTGTYDGTQWLDNSQ